jgi:hypothetical protein
MLTYDVLLAGVSSHYQSKHKEPKDVLLAGLSSQPPGIYASRSPSCCYVIGTSHVHQRHDNLPTSPCVHKYKALLYARPSMLHDNNNAKEN